MTRLVVVGSSNTDLVLRCERLPSPGETLLGGDFAQFAGGKGANQAVAAARAGVKVSFVGAHGADDFGRAAKAGLRSEGIDVRHFREHAGVSSGVALILVGGKARENLIGVARSANDHLSAAHVEAASAAFSRAHAVVTQLEVSLEAVDAAARLAVEHNVPFILNPAPAKKLSKRLLQMVSVITPNEHEAALLTGCTRPDDAARQLHAKGCRAVVVTLGAKGALVSDGQTQRRIAAPRVKPVDTVGAGDCFTAWLAVELARGASLVAAAEHAVRAAALAITRPGAQAGMPTRAEVEMFQTSGK
ncbi:ribokinase [Verrucomicrobiota bacterium sgz303538]